jgi:signal transduction histidine kinase
MSALARDAAFSARVALGLLALGAATAGLAIAEGPGRATTYAGASSWAAVLTVGAGLGLAAAGVMLILEQRGRRLGDLALVAAVTWFAPLWVAWQEGPPLVRSLATVLVALTFPLLVHLVAAWPSGLSSATARLLVAAVYVESVTAAVLLALFRDPYFDPSCWANCNVNSFLVTPLPSLADRVEIIDRWFVAAAALTFAVGCLIRLRRASPVARRRLAAVLVPALVLFGAVIAHAFALQRTSIEYPFNVSLQAIFAATAAAVTLISAGFIHAAARRRVERRSVERVIASLGEAPSPGSLQTALAEAVGDADLHIVYPRGGGGWVTAHGLPIAEPTAAPNRILTHLKRGDSTVALVSHTDAVPDLERHLGPSFLLGLENERLQAEVLARLEELRASRARIVETADLERRKLERDLHDGAQQRLLALSYDLRLAQTAAEADGDDVTASALTKAIKQTRAALEELRELAHGIYPAVLTEAGLGPALATLADTAPLPVAVTGGDGARYPTTVENAAFFLAAEALSDAGRRGAAQADVRLDTRDGHLVVTVDDDGAERASGLSSLADRVGALGGTLVITPRSLRAEIPCE